MTVLEDYYCSDFWKRQGWMAPWLEQVSPDYWREMILAIGESMARPNWRQHVLTDAGRAQLRVQLCTRISQASDIFIPWLAQALTLKGLRILEIGCGSGSSTAGLTHAGAKVTGIDIQRKSLTLARKRLSLLGYGAEFIEASPDWLQVAPQEGDFAGPFDLIVCYAMLEHLLVRERLNLLSLCRRIMARDGALLATYETPNRFSPFDWHSSKLSFTDVLPDDLALEFAKQRSSRADHPARLRASPGIEPREALYRFGRGVSWHEFDLAFEMRNLQVVLDGYSPKSSNHQKNYRPDEAFEEALAGIFARMDPPVPRGFCRPSLELLLKFAPHRS